MTPYRIKQHRKRAHHGSHMALVPFIDMLTMLVVFLLLHSSRSPSRWPISSRTRP